MSETPFKDRLEAVLSSATLNGIDFVEVDESQTTLRVHFLNAVDVSGNPTSATISGGTTISSVDVDPIEPGSWSTDDGQPLLTLTVAAPGDFSYYTLELANAGLDPFYTSSVFSFKANCPSDLDCKTEGPECAFEAPASPTIDYRAKDFLSFRQALIDFSTQNYPEWVERSEADFGMMFLEALSALADDLSYYQDRVSWEATLETASERRSLVRLARLVDYEPRPATAARALLQLDVVKEITTVPAGLAFKATAADGTDLYFESGNGLLDPATGRLSAESFPVDERWNRGRLKPYIFDAGQACLGVGSTEMYVQGHGLGLTSGVELLLDTPASSTADPPVRTVVKLVAVEETEDPVFLSDGAPTKVTLLTWGSDTAPTQDHALFWSEADAAARGGDYERTILAGNLVPSTHGKRVVEAFVIPNEDGSWPSSTADPSLAVVRTGPNDSPETPSPLILYTLSQQPLTWLAGQSDTDRPRPELALERTDADETDEWRWLRSLLEAELFESAYTVDPMKYSTVAQGEDGWTAHDYDGDAGHSIRFGDGVFGELPDWGAVFEATYRVGAGSVGNVARDTITSVTSEASTYVTAVTNPFPAEGGIDEETDDEIRRDAPQAFRATQYRAVRRADYEAAAKTLDWVQQAGTRFRWTGSWLTVFTSADPVSSEELAIANHLELIELLNRWRMAGYESYVPEPVYASLDIKIRACACSDAFRGEVARSLLETLGTGSTSSGTTGFFHPDNFTFGKSLERSALEAAIESSYGVCGVLSIDYRRRGYTNDFVTMPETVSIGRFEILRVNNDPNFPEHGSLKITMEGGK